MNKIFLILLSSFLSFSLSAQFSIYNEVKKLIQEKHPEIDLNQKLIGFVIWSNKDAKSIETIKAFNQTVVVYNQARLKGGLKGIEILAVNLENLSPESMILLEKEEITKLIPVQKAEVEGLVFKQLQSLVFDSAGNEVYRDLKPSLVYSSINKLITR